MLQNYCPPSIFYNAKKFACIAESKEASANKLCGKYFIGIYKI